MQPPRPGVTLEILTADDQPGPIADPAVFREAPAKRRYEQERLIAPEHGLHHGRADCRDDLELVTPSADQPDCLEHLLFHIERRLRRSGCLETRVAAAAVVSRDDLMAI